MTISIRSANEEDAGLLSRLGGGLFSQTFAHLYDPVDLSFFLNTSHSEQKIRDDMSHGARYGIAFFHQKPIGYIKFGKNGLPVGIGVGRQFEIKQLYIERAYHRQKIGQRLMDFAFSQMAPNPSDLIFVGVWTENFLAQKFYARLGFDPFACYWYPVGRKLDRELIMVKSLNLSFV